MQHINKCQTEFNSIWPKAESFHEQPTYWSDHPLVQLDDSSRYSTSVNCTHSLLTPPTSFGIARNCPGGDPDSARDQCVFVSKRRSVQHLLYFLFLLTVYFLLVLRTRNRNKSGGKSTSQGRRDFLFKSGGKFKHLFQIVLFFYWLFFISFERYKKK